jgi:hypothetical protein
MSATDVGFGSRLKVQSRGMYKKEPVLTESKKQLRLFAGP